MKPQDFIKELKRMHNSQKCGCGACKLDNLPCLGYMCCDEKVFAELYSEVEKWSDLHPIETRQDRFLKLFPNAKMTDFWGKGAAAKEPLDICPNLINKNQVDSRGCEHNSCYICRKKYWLAPADENE